MKRHWTDSLTTRGWIVFWAVMVIGMFLVGFGTANECWNDHGYSSCTDLVSQVSK